ncbi:hypothetical protein SGQ83_01275 [Flavobacterium sp. Fl-318]|uniref:Uncharacterized protein n=1 Tax=Flavobacterium cupriresistens TaxID=2893885 RepID=A0ABU4RBR4_9FLAO|nr:MULTISPECIES: hypothetical protein [unclassified Flavobacterium]MDX6187966.1 hypothetical protein [Flavobacterium sp. Fl-318]UFH42114.1 hypothetical protein LNP23_20175 [Flavobacterium sp. F-323]
MSKKATHYFVYVGHSTTTKNKLQEEFQKYLNSLSATLITADKLKELKKAIIDKSIELNVIHKRCTPLKISFSDGYYNKGLIISGFHSLIFHILNAYDVN